MIQNRNQSGDVHQKSIEALDISLFGPLDHFDTPSYCPGLCELRAQRRIGRVRGREGEKAADKPAKYKQVQAVFCHMSHSQTSSVDHTSPTKKLL